MMSFDAHRRRPVAPNLTPLVDVLFILVIFLVLAANFRRVPSIEVDLPSSSHSEAAAQHALTVSIDAQGGLRVAEQPVARRALAEHLRAMRPRYEALLIVADRAVDLEYAVAGLGEAGRAGFLDLSIATREPSP